MKIRVLFGIRKESYPEEYGPEALLAQSTPATTIRRTQAHSCKAHALRVEHELLYSPYYTQ